MVDKAILELGPPVAGVATWRAAAGMGLGYPVRVQKGTLIPEIEAAPDKTQC
jgi:hypothetical protein